MHDCFEVYANLFKVTSKLSKIPLASVLVLTILGVFINVRACVFDVVIIVFVD